MGGCSVKCHTYHGPEDSHNTIAMYCSLSLLSLLLVLYLYFYFYYSIAYSNIKRNPFSHSVHLHSLIPNIHFCCIAEEGNALINFSMKSNHIVKTEKKIRYRHTQLYSEDIRLHNESFTHITQCIFHQFP